MPLTFNGIQPVKFGGRDCTPKLDVEIQLRLQNIKVFNEEADEVLASAFPNDIEYVRNFLRNNMTILEKEELQIYLIGGETGLRNMDKLMQAGVQQNDDR